ncbi:MAG: hypothetical protein D8M58_18980 [Calditrichaeota bacterium]|nr:MAG: hypothetical protein DWQ03_21660 [Calditrichota bacterium]MBL1207495.1 hypothetical protein [Calditrichota bacterium]NOG47327.1 hypothetical protein [Calditrichota bacterium]
MKYILAFTITALLFSCNQQKITQLEVELQQVKKQNELIMEQSSGKDQFIEEYTTTLNEVYDNLENIRKREGMITEYSKSIEKSKEANVKKKMLSNIESIDNYINRSKKKLNTLKTRFKDSEMTSKAFEETIEKLTKELEEKELYIAELRTEVDSLNQKVAQASFDIKERDLIIEEQTEQMNVAHYIIGTDDELEEKQIITEKGGFIGIGTTTVVSSTLNRDDFVTANISDTETITISGNKEDIEIISAHATGSYELVGETEEETKLEIKDPDEFWKMRYLVILVE